MLIGIDGNEANEVRADIGERVGVNMYGFEILWGLFKENNKRKKRHNFTVYLRNQPSVDLPGENSFLGKGSRISPTEKPSGRFQAILGGMPL